MFALPQASDLLKAQISPASPPKAQRFTCVKLLPPQTISASAAPPGEPLLLDRFEGLPEMSFMIDFGY